MAFDPPAPDLTKLRADWEEWERGEAPPGQVLANLKTHGMARLLRTLVESGYQVDA